VAEEKTHNVRLDNGYLMKNVPTDLSKAEILEIAIKNNLIEDTRLEPLTVADKALGATQSLIDGLTAGFAAKANAGFQTPILAGIEYAKGNEVDVGKIYREKRDMLRNLGGRFEADYPVTDATLNIAGSMAPFSRMAKVAGTGVGALMGAGAAYGGANYLGGLDEIEDYSGPMGIGAMGTSALGTAAGGKGIELIGAGLAPAMTAGARYLTDKGIPTTIGEKLGGGFKNMEEKAMSLPFVGNVIKNAKSRGLDQYSRSTVDDALEVVGKKLPDNIATGRDAMQWANYNIDSRYDDILSVMPLRADAQLKAELTTLNEMISQLPKDYAKIVRKKMSNMLKDFDNKTGTMTGESFKIADRGLRDQGRKWQKSQEALAQEAGNALLAIRGTLRQAAQRQHPTQKAALDATDKAFAKMRTIDDAAVMTGAKEGVISPAQHLNAIKKNTSKKQYAQGGGYDQRGAELAKGTMVNELPNSGTADRLFPMMMLGGGTVAEPVTLAAYGAGAGVASLPYTKAGQKIVDKWFDPSMRRTNVSELIKSFAPVSAATTVNATEGINPGVIIDNPSAVTDIFK